MKGEFKSFSYASQYISVYKQDFIKMGLIINDKVPSHDTLRRMFMLLDANSIKEIIINNLNSFLTKILNNYSSSKKELISIDGKEFKGSGRSINSKKKMNNKNVLNVYNSSKEICIYSNPLDDKESEIKEAQEILNKYNLKNIVVTGDALHCQKRTCEIIVNKKGDYVFTVKENQSALLEEMKTRIVNSKSIISKSYNDCDYSILLLPSSTVTSLAGCQTKSTTEPVTVGTRNAIPSNFPFNSGKASATALAAPVVVGTILAAAARARRELIPFL